MNLAIVSYVCYMELRFLIQYAKITTSQRDFLRNFHSDNLKTGKIKQNRKK